MPATSGHVALVAAAANLTLCALVGTVLLVTGGREDTPAAAPPPSEYLSSTDSIPATTPSTTTATTTSATASDDFDTVTAGDGFSTVVPRGWPTKSLPNAPGAFQATDPADSTNYVRYGGAAAKGDIYQSHTDYERERSKQLTGLTRVQLTPMTVRGNEAVDWEFTWSAPEGERHVRSVYWRTGGIEYFVYVSSLASVWEPMPTLLSTMTERARP